MTPEMQAFAVGFPVTLLHAALTWALLAAGATVYVLLTAHKELALIRAGNVAAAVSFGGVLVGLAIPLAMSLAASNAFLDIVIWGVATMVVQMLVFRVTDFALKGLSHRIESGEVAAAAMLVGAKLSVALILAAAVAG